MKIEVKLFEGGKMPQVNEKGDLFDVFAREGVTLKGPQSGVLHQVNNEKLRDVEFSSTLIPLGFAMGLPEGFKANLCSRSSTYPKWKIILWNAVGKIDSSYSGDEDEWKCGVIAFGHTEIKPGDKIAQFEIYPSSKATVWQKLKWLFSNKIEFVEVESLNKESRGGFGTTGSK